MFFWIFLVERQSDQFVGRSLSQVFSRPQDASGHATTHRVPYHAHCPSTGEVLKSKVWIDSVIGDLNIKNYVCVYEYVCVWNKYMYDRKSHLKPCSRSHLHPDSSSSNRRIGSRELVNASPRVFRLGEWELEDSGGRGSPNVIGMPTGCQRRMPWWVEHDWTPSNLAQFPAISCNVYFIQIPVLWCSGKCRTHTSIVST